MSDHAALLARARALAVSRLAAFLSRGLDALPEDLAALGVASSAPAEQRILRQAGAQVGATRTAVERIFAAHFVAVFDRKAAGAAPRPAVAETSLDALTLVDDAAIELEIAMGKLVRKTVGEIDPEQLLGIEARIGEIVADRLIEGAENPLGAETALEALKEACDAVPENGSVRMVFANSLQPHLASGLRQAFREVNEMLVAAGIQPKIRYTLERARDGAKTAERPASHIPQGMSVSQALSLRELLPTQTGAPLDIGALIATMIAASPARGLAGGARMLANPEGVLFRSAMATPVSPALVESLNAQQRTVSQGDLAAMLAGLRGMAAAGEHPLDQVTGELVANVFDYIQGDQAVPEAVKHEIGRLPVAAFKAAVLDRSFFARREHPLREFLGEVARIAADPETDAGPDSPFVEGLRTVVDEVIGAFDTDLGVFEKAGGELRTRAEEAAETRAQALVPQTAAIERLERAESAHAAALVDVNARLEEPAPPFVSAFLTETWTRALADADMNDRTGDDARAARLELVDALLWSVAPKQATDVPQLAAMLGKLVAGLQRGMKSAGTPPAMQQAFLGELMRTHTDLLQAARAAKGASPSPPPQKPMPKPAPLPPPPVASFEPTSAVDRMTRGTIVEFSDDAPPMRAKLTWISPKRTVFLFTSSSAGAQQRTRAALETALNDGTVRVVEEERTVVERALAAAVQEQPAR